MRIALTADPEIPVPPRHYGGIERIVDMLSRGLIERGHDVTLFAHPDSRSAGELIPWPGRSSGSARDVLGNSKTLVSAITRKRFDIVHSFSRLAYLTPILPFGVPKIMSYQREISVRSVKWGHAISRGTLSFTAISRWMLRRVENIGSWTMIPNGVPMSVYDFRRGVPPDAPLVFLGRIEEIKGPHIAIDVAMRTGRKLVIAGNIPNEKRAWAQEHVLRYVDDDRIKYLGPVDDKQKNFLLGASAALLMPILWEEPFGIVMAEAMACGTPIIGLRRGSVSEVVTDGDTGIVADDIEGLAIGVSRLNELDRAACRARAEELYSDSAVVTAYEQLYRRQVALRRQAS